MDSDFRFVFSGWPFNDLSQVESSALDTAKFQTTMEKVVDQHIGTYSKWLAKCFRVHLDRRTADVIRGFISAPGDAWPRLPGLILPRHARRRTRDEDPTGLFRLMRSACGGSQDDHLQCHTRPGT
jgi:hypothetical protein